MATGNKTWKGLAVPLNGESQINQITAADDVLTITGASGQTGDFLVFENSSGTELAYVDANGYIHTPRLAMTVLTTEPTTGLTKGEVVVVFPSADKPSIGVCISTATNEIKYVGGWSLTAGRQT